MSAESGSSKAWVWVAALLTTLVGVALYLFKTVVRDKAGAQLALADVAEKNAKRSIAQRTKKIRELSKDVHKNGRKIAKLENSIESTKTKLRTKLESRGLDGGEIAARFNRLRE